MIPFIKHHSPSSLNLFVASPAMWVLEKVLGVKQPANAPMIRGRAVEDGVTRGLMNPDAPLEDCVEVAYRCYDAEMVLSGDPRREKYRDTIPDMVRLVLQELHQYGVPSAAQGLVEWHPDVLTLPVIGYFDYRWDQHGILVDLKTTEKIPGEIKPSHARQVALYVGDSNTVGHLIYVSSKRIEPYLLENAVEHREVLLRIALRLEKFLSASDDPDYFVDVTVPDIESFYWSNPVARALAFEHWRI